MQRRRICRHTADWRRQWSHDKANATKSVGAGILDRQKSDAIDEDRRYLMDAKAESSKQAREEVKKQCIYSGACLVVLGGGSENAAASALVTTA